MSSDIEELYLQKLHEFIFDEDKIVTFSWLCKELNIDVKLAKTLLQTFVTDHRTSKPTELSVSYVLLGILKDNVSSVVMTVKEKELEGKKVLFETICSESIYSVQKSDNLDFSMISLVDMFDVNHPTDKPRLGSIIGKNCVKRNLKVKKSLPEINRSAPTDKSKATHLFSSTSKIKSEEKSEKVQAPKPNVVAEVKKNGTTTKKSPPKDDKKNKTNNNPKGGIASFLSKFPPKKETNQQMEIKTEKIPAKQENKSDSPKKNEEIIVKSPKKEEEEEAMDVDDDEPVPRKSKKSVLYDSDTDEEAKKIEERNKKQGGNSTTKKRKTSAKRKNEDSHKKAQKKRKRFVERSDSDSDDIFGDNKEEEEDIIESDEEPVYKKASVTQLAPKNKQRKFVNQTYTDEEGFIVTVKEGVVVSASEEEEEKEQKDPQIVEKPVPKLKKESSNEISPTKGTKGKKAAKVASNQPKLTNFFKKS